jgi:hypothetical protein
MSDYNNVVISVTQEHIDLNGHSCKNCPVHRAICEALSLDPDRVTVGRHTTRIDLVAYNTPAEVNRYDKPHGKMFPFTFPLRIKY